jgi:hypothetical protein
MSLGYDRTPPSHARCRLQDKRARDRSSLTWATTTALWYSLTSGVGGVRGSNPFCCRLTLVGEAAREVVASSSCLAASLLQPRNMHSAC